MLGGSCREGLQIHTRPEQASALPGESQQRGRRGAGTVNPQREEASCSLRARCSVSTDQPATPIPLQTGSSTQNKSGQISAKLLTETLSKWGQSAMLQIAGGASQGAAHLEKRKAAALHLLSACPGQQERAGKPKGGRLDAEGKLRLSNSEGNDF